MITYLGIDPGLSGALALYHPTTQQVTTFAMPTHERTVNGKRKRHLDLAGLANWFDLYVPTETHAFVEDPNAMPGQGVTSMFTFGKIVGICQMAVVMANLRYTLVRPNVWKKVLGLTKDKDHARQRASQLFPDAAAQWALTSQDGRAEAALLAYYGSRQ